MTRTKKVFWVCFSIGAFALLGLLYAHFSTPEGMFDDLDIGSEHFAYWEFANGQVHLITPDSRRLMGQYRKQGKTWLFERSRGQTYYVEASLFGFWLVESNGNIVLPERKRLFIRPTVPKGKNEN